MLKETKEQFQQRQIFRFAANESFLRFHASESSPNVMMKYDSLYKNSPMIPGLHLAQFFWRGYVNIWLGV